MEGQDWSFLSLETHFSLTKEEKRFVDGKKREKKDEKWSEMED